MIAAASRASIAACILAALLAAASRTALHAQTLIEDAHAGHVPVGLSVVWRVDGRRLRDQIGAWSMHAFSSDGRLVAIADETGVRVRRTKDGSLERMLWHGFAARDVYAVAVASSGDVAVGRIGGVNVHATGAGRAVRYDCRDHCGPVGAVAFSPDGTLLAFQGARGLAERRNGLGSVNVVDLRTGGGLAELQASAVRARLEFSPDGTRLLGASTTPFDDRESFGIRVWDAADWHVTHNLLGSTRPTRSAGALDRLEFGAVYERDGRLETRDLATSGVLWSVPLVAPPLDVEDRVYETRLKLLEIAPNGAFLVSYEVPATAHSDMRALGAIVIRRAQDGAVVAMYEVADVTSLAIAPDGKTFIYTTGSGQTYTALARVPL